MAYSEPITTLNVWPKSVFPVELGETVTWLFTPKGGAEYNVDSIISFDLAGKRAYRVHRTQCGGPSERYFTCNHKPSNEISVSFTPTEEFYGSEVIATYFKDWESLWAGKAPVLFREVIKLTKQATYINMVMELKEPSRFTPEAPTGLRLEPPIFLTESHVRVDCETDGSLPPVPISFIIECPPPPTAVVEHDRVTQAKLNLSYEKFYRTYGFRSPPTLSDLAPYVARKHASQILRNGHVAPGKTNKTLRAVLSITEKAHNCHVVCSVPGKETRRHMTVYHPTTISYLLPRPRDGYLQVGSEITCYADGHPPPMLSLRLVQPLRPPKPLSEEELETLRQVGRIPKLRDEDPITRELILTSSGLDLIPQQVDKPADSNSDGRSSSVSSGTLRQLPHEMNSRGFSGNGKEPYEMAKRIPGIGLSTIERHRQLGLHPSEYTIQGATFRLAPNATPGVELLLTCSARNVLPGDTTFLGMNGTITRTRFVVSDPESRSSTITISYASLGISLGVCAFVLLILLVIIAGMLLQKRSQVQTSGATDRMLANGMKKPRPGPKPQYAKSQPVSRAVPTSNDRSVTQSHTVVVPGPSVAHTVYSVEPNYDYDAVYNSSGSELPRTNSLSQRNAKDLQYVELSFDRSPPGRETLPGTASLRGGATSASMTLFGSSQRHSHPSTRTFGASVPHGLDMTCGNRSPLKQCHAVPDETSHYTEIVAFIQPKAHSSQIVLQQQQEAAQALLAMQQNKPRVFV